MADPVALTVQYSGTSLVIDCTSDIQTVSTTDLLTISINGGAAVTLSAVPFNQSSYVWWPFPSGTKANPGDTVTVTIPSGALTETAGAVTPGTYTATNGSLVQQLPDTPVGSKTLKVGYNVESGYYYEPASIYSNQAKMGSTFSNTLGQVDSNGFPLPSTGGGQGLIVCSPTAAGPYSSYPLAPAGTWFFMWDGASADFFVVGGTFLSGATGQATNNWKSYDVPNASGALCPYVNCVFNYGSGTATNLRIFPADPAITGGGSGPPANPPRFWPAMVSKLASAKLIRAKDLLQTDGGVTKVDYAQFPTRSWATNTYIPPDSFVGVSRVDPYTSGPFLVSSSTMLLITTSAPHSFQNGQTLNWNGPTTRYVTLADSTTGSYLTNGNPVWVIDSTHLCMQALVFDSSSNITSQSFTGLDITDGSILYLTHTGCPPEDCAELASLTPGQELWYNPPIISSEASLTSQAEAILSVYPDRPLYLELGNEPWNTAGGFLQVNLYVRTFGLNLAPPFGPLGAVGSPTGHEAYVYLAARALRLFRAAWTAAGRDPNQVRLILNAGIWSGVATAYLNYAATHDWYGYPNTDPSYSGTPIDVFAIAIINYWDMPGGDGGTCDALTVEQHMDWGDVVFGTALGAAHSRFWAYWPVQLILQHQAEIAATPLPNTKVVCYEGGPSYTGLGGTDSLANAKTVAWEFHPRARNQVLHALQAFNDTGEYAHCRLGMSSFITTEVTSGTNQYRIYGTYQGPQQLPGRGDGSDGRFNNLALPLADPTTGMAIPSPDITNLVSVVGNAYDSWSAAPAGLTAGTLSHGTVAYNSVPLSIATNSGGVGPYSNAFQRSDDGGTTWATKGTVSGSTASFTDATVAASTTYLYRVVVTDSATPTPATATSNSVSVTTPAAPVTLAAGTLSHGTIAYNSVALSIATNSGGTSPYANQLQRSPQGAGTWANVGAPVSGATASFTDATVSASTAYDYRVIVTDSTTPTAAQATSNTVTVTTPSAPPPGSGYLALAAGGGFVVLQTG